MYTNIACLLTIIFFIFGRYVYPFISWISGSIDTLTMLIGIPMWIALLSTIICTIFTIIQKKKFKHISTKLKFIWPILVSVFLSSVLLALLFSGDLEPQYWYSKDDATYTGFVVEPSSTKKTKTWGKCFVNDVACYSCFGNLKFRVNESSLSSHRNKIFKVYDRNGQKRIIIVHNQPFGSYDYEYHEDYNGSKYKYTREETELTLTRIYDASGNFLESPNKKDFYSKYYYPDNKWECLYKDRYNDKFINDRSYNDEMKFQFIESLGYTLSEDYLSERERIRRRMISDCN